MVARLLASTNRPDRSKIEPLTAKASGLTHFCHDSRMPRAPRGFPLRRVPARTHFTSASTALPPPDFRSETDGIDKSGR